MARAASEARRVGVHRKPAHKRSALRQHARQRQLRRLAPRARVACLKRQLRAQRGYRSLNLQRNLARRFYHQRLGNSVRRVQRV